MKKADKELHNDVSSPEPFLYVRLEGVKVRGDRPIPLKQASHTPKPCETCGVTGLPPCQALPGKLQRAAS